MAHVLAEGIMRMRSLSAVLLLLMAVTARAQDGVAVKGTIVDADGKPVAGVEVAPFWIGKAGGMTAFSPAKTDAHGKYTVKVPQWMTEPALLAIAPDRKTGGTLAYKSKESTDLPPIKLGPLVKVSGRFESKELSRKPPWTNVYISITKQARIVQSDSCDATFAFLLPPGKYIFNGYGQDVKGINREIDVPADKPELDLGAIDLPATEIAKHVGKEPPAWNVTDARGLSKAVSLADLKGKWVLIEFWGFW
jgi:hypothetical protein